MSMQSFGSKERRITALAEKASQDLSQADTSFLIKMIRDRYSGPALRSLIYAICQVNLPGLEALLEPYIYNSDPEIRTQGLMAVLRLGLTLKYKEHMLATAALPAIDDKTAVLVGMALSCMGMFLQDHTDLDFIQVLGKVLVRLLPADELSSSDRWIVIYARRAACFAMGMELFTDAVTKQAEDVYVARFLHERVGTQFDGVSSRPWSINTSQR